MAKVLTGVDAALGALAEGSDDAVKNEFTYLRSGNSFTVKVPGLNMISEYVYGSYGKKIYSFVAENPSEKTERGFPTNNLTPFDKAYKYYKEQSDDWQDAMSQEANHYRATQKFTIGFYDLDSGEPIMVEFTRNQAQAIVATIKQYVKRLGQFAFTLSKQGSGTNTTVSLSLIPVLEDLTDKQRENFEKLPNDFDAKNFEGLYYTMSDEEQIETLAKSGFDVSLIGLEVPREGDKKGDDQGDKGSARENDAPLDIDEEDLPF